MLKLYSVMQYKAWKSKIMRKAIFIEVIPNQIDQLSWFETMGTLKL